MTLQTMQEHEAVTLHHGVRDFRRRSLNALVRRHVRGRDVLDMRCLTGHLAVSLAEEGYRVTALDAYAQAVELTNGRARARGLPELARHWDLTGLVGRVGGEERFDTVLCVDVLNHVADDRATLADVARVLRPGGRLVLLVPALHRLLGARDRRLGHLRRYSRDELRALLATHGFHVDGLRSWNSLPLPFQFLWEGVLGRELKDDARYGPENAAGAILNRILAGWYLAVENRVAFPAGLSLLALATRSASAFVPPQKRDRAPREGEPGSRRNAPTG